MLILEQVVTLYLKFFFMMVPFFVLSVFLTFSKNQTKEEKHGVLFRYGIAVTISCLIFLLFGKYIFALFGITLDAFKIGAGAVLFLSALQMINGDTEKPELDKKRASDYAIVPLAIPGTVGPGLIGVLMVLGAELGSAIDISIAVIALLLAIASQIGMLLTSNKIKRLLGNQGMEILTKITGLFVTAIGAQIVFGGIKGFLF